MEMHEEQVGAVTALAVKGRLDSTTAPLLGARLESAMARPGASVVVDFVNLEYVSSAGYMRNTDMRPTCCSPLNTLTTSGGRSSTP